MISVYSYSATVNATPEKRGKKDGYLVQYPSGPIVWVEADIFEKFFRKLKEVR